jgi:hypothetical protein
MAMLKHHYTNKHSRFNDVYQYDVTFGIKKEFNIHFREFRFFKSCEYSNKVESEDACIDKLIEIVKSL